MTEREWSKLCRNIFEQKCILMLGSEFPVELQAAGSTTETSLSKLLFEKISSELVDFPRLPGFYDKEFKQVDLCQLSRDYIFYNDSNQVQSREDLETLISEYLVELAPALHSTYFDKLATLPFYFFVDTNYGNLFFERLKKADKQPKKDFYDFKGSQVAVSNINSAYRKIGSETEPFIYSLYGSIEDPNSLAVSDYDLIQLLNNIISKTPGLPADVRAELAHEETCILFLGFGMLNKNWYFRILLHALTSGNKKTMSYALDYLTTVNYDQDPAVLFFKDELKVCLYQLDQKQFIQTLVEKYTGFNDRHSNFKPKVTGADRALIAEEIKVFISYKRQDIEAVRPIVNKLKSNNITVIWDQDENFTGEWESRLQQMIENADAFLLMQSRNLMEAPVNYVNVEIRLAMKRADRFTRTDLFLFPAYIDSKESRMTDTDFDFINSINNWDLTLPENVDRLAREILRNRERNKKSNVA